VIAKVEVDTEGFLQGGTRRCPMAELPPTFDKRGRRVAGVILVIGILASVVWVLSTWRGWTILLSVSRIAIVITAITLIPTAAEQLTERWGRLARVMLQIGLFIALLPVIALLFLGTSGVGAWIAYGAGLVILVEGGGYIVGRNKELILQRLFRSVWPAGLRSEVETIKKMFYSQWTLYIAAPLGLIVGTIIGLLGSWSLQSTVMLCLQLILILASLVLLCFLVFAFVRMSDPLFETRDVPSPRLTEEPRGVFLKRLRKVFTFLAPRPEPESKDQEDKDLDLAVMVADLRKVYLYDSMHNVMLFAGFSAVAVSQWGIEVDIKCLVGSLIGLSLMFNQLPYVIGQSAFHERLLERYEGTKRVEIKEKLKKYSPLYLKLDFSAGLFATGTAGGVVYYLLDQFVKSTLK
jgi:MFS family permease